MRKRPLHVILASASEQVKKNLLGKLLSLNTTPICLSPNELLIHPDHFLTPRASIVIYDLTKSSFMDGFATLQNIALQRITTADVYSDG